MDYEFIKSRLAPCGLHCGKCFAFKDGDISEYSKKLQQSLGNFDIYAERFVDLLNAPVFAKFPEFKDMLNHFAKAECGGCRKENCKLFKNCKVRSCAEAKKVDFCFECPEFPCGNTGFDRNLEERSIKINQRIEAIGVEDYYNEIKELARY